MPSTGKERGRSGVKWLLAALALGAGILLFVAGAIWQWLDQPGTALMVVGGALAGPAYIAIMAREEARSP